MTMEEINCNVEIDSDIFSLCSDSDPGEEDNAVEEMFVNEDSGEDSDKEVQAPQAAKHLSALHCNLNGFKTHAIDVEATIARMEKPPDIVLLNETKMRPSEQAMKLTGYDIL